MDVQQLLAETRDALTVSRVFGEPFERDGVTILPVARVQGGAGGGSGTTGAEGGAGGGMGLKVAPAGVFAIREGAVRWYPAVDVNKIVFMGQAMGMVALVVVGRVLAGRRDPSSRRVSPRRRH